MKTHEFTANDFALFETAVRRYMADFGMADWVVTIMHDQIGEGVMAQVQYKALAKSACFRLTKHAEFDYGLSHDPVRLALHEVLHLLLADFCETCAKLGDAVHELVIAREHEVLHRLMRVIT